MNIRLVFLLLAWGILLAGAACAQESTLPQPIPKPEPGAEPAPVTPTPQAPPTALLFQPAPVHAPVVGPPATPASPFPGPQAILQAEAIYWWVNASNTPVLLTSSNGTSAGVLGQASTVPLAGGGSNDLEGMSGVRISGRYLLDDLWGLWGRGIYLANGGHFDTITRGILAIPYVDANNNANSSLLIANPGTNTGWAAIERYAQLWGMEACGIFQYSIEPENPMDLLAGLRYQQLFERFRLRALTTSTAAGQFVGQATPANSTYVGLDYFTVHNHFFGPQVGMTSTWNSGGNWSIESGMSLGVGLTQQVATVTGYTNLGSPAQKTTPGFIFSQVSNIGRYTRNVITVLPQGHVGVGYQVFKSVRLKAGADLMYWSNVARANSMISGTVNPTLIPLLSTGVQTGASQPTGGISSGEYWAVGLTLGVDIAF